MNADQEFRIVTLVSAGRHPVSGRARRAINDAQALEMGLGLIDQYPATLQTLHAGHAPAHALESELRPHLDSYLRPYLGMGLAEIEVLALPPEADVLPTLITRLRELQPQLILTGVQAESGWCSGCLPYFLAQALDRPIVSSVDQIVPGDTFSSAEVRQVLPRGQRRRLEVRLPAVIMIDPAAPAPRQSAFARARRGRLRIHSVITENFPPPFLGDRQPARQRPKRLRIDSALPAADRLRAITETATGHNRLVEPASAAEAARLIHDYLVEHGLLKPQS